MENTWVGKDKTQLELLAQRISQLTKLEELSLIGQNSRKWTKISQPLNILHLKELHETSCPSEQSPEGIDGGQCRPPLKIRKFMIFHGES